MNDIDPSVIYDIPPFTAKYVGHLTVFRVPGGWLMGQNLRDDLVFVPFNNEYQPRQPQEYSL